MITQKDVKDVIEYSDVKSVWQHLEKTFGLNVNIHEENFKQYFINHPKHRYPEYKNLGIVFVDFGKQEIEPLLNKILQRDDSYPTWNNLLRFLLKDKLADTSAQRDYYKSGAWKSVRIEHHDQAGLQNNFISF